MSGLHGIVYTTSKCCVNLQPAKSFFNAAVDPPSHVLLHFRVDDTVCIAPVKRITNPPLSQLTVGSSCKVKWDSKKEFDATVLCLGKKFEWPLIHSVLLDYNTFQAMQMWWLGQKVNGFHIKGRRKSVTMRMRLAIARKLLMWR